LVTTSSTVAKCTACGANVETCSSTAALTCLSGYYLPSASSTTCTACSFGASTCTSSDI